MAPRWGFVAGIVLVASGASWTAAFAQARTSRLLSAESQLVGTWRLRRYEAWNTQTKAPIDSLNSDRWPGILTYDALGNMTVQIDRRTPRGGVYLAYFGTYSVDAAAHTVTHRLVAASAIYRPGADNVRQYDLSSDGRTLTLTAHGSVAAGVSVRLTWVKQR